jgi:CPA2 family monovalent cation:H+ antiporter-2
MPQTLQLILVLLAAAVVVVVICRLVRLPPILGYLLVGMAVGPHALALVPDTADVHDLAEFGIVFLMFSIGLEFSLPQLRSMRHSVFGLGSRRSRSPRSWAWWCCRRLASAGRRASRWAARWR